MEAIGKTLQRNPLVSGNTEELNRQIEEKKNVLLQFKCNPRIPMSYEEFKQLLSMHAQDIMVRRSVTVPFVIDSNNGPIIRNLYLYFMNDKQCAWNLNAGLLFGGKVGCGKSILMTAFLRITDEYTLKRTTVVHSKSLANMIKTKSIEFYERRPMFIDELGREETENKDYGNVIKPVIDLFALRYESGARTYATSNFKMETLGTKEYYGDFIRSRMEEMMTYVHIPGESRRLKNEVKTK